MTSPNSMIFFVNILVPFLAGAVYFVMAAEIKRVSRVRKLIFGEIGYNKAFNAFLMFGVYFITRPLQNLLGPHPMPMIVNSARQFFLMAVIAPSILVGIMHWVPSESGGEKPIPQSTTVAAYLVGLMMAVVFIILNSIAIDGSKIIATYNGINVYDAKWFSSIETTREEKNLSAKSEVPTENITNYAVAEIQQNSGCSTVSVAIPESDNSKKRMDSAETVNNATRRDNPAHNPQSFIFPKARLITIHLITQLISPVGYFILAAAYVRHRRHKYPMSSVYNLMPKKWRYLEAGLLIFALSMITAGAAAFFGQYYTYLWVIYFLAAIVAGIIELISVKIPPREAPSDLRNN